MSKTIFHRLFGVGRLPRKFSAPLRREGIVLLDEGIGGSVTLKNFRAPGRYSSWRRNWFTGSIVLTKQTFAAFALFKPLIFVPLGDERFSALAISLESENVLLVAFDASVFNEKWSGNVECRFKTPTARRFEGELT